MKTLDTEAKIIAEKQMYGSIAEERAFRDGYVTGAQSERNNTIDECLDIINHPFETVDADRILGYIEAKITCLKVGSEP